MTTTEPRRFVDTPESWFGALEAVLLDGLSDWMVRKEFVAVEEFRGLLSVPPEGDQVGHDRAGYVSAMREANSSVYGSW